MNDLQILPIRLEEDIQPGDDLTELLAQALYKRALSLRDEDVLVVCHKIISKAEGKIVALEGVRPSALAKSWAARFDRDARLIEVVLSQARRIVRMEEGLVIAETIHGFVAANCGVDTSNAPPDCAVLLPSAPDVSAKRLAEGLGRRFGCRLSCIVSDTFGRPWRMGLLEVAIGVWGFAPLIDLRGEPDRAGREMRSSIVALADQAAAAAGLVMKKDAGIPAVLIRGLELPGPRRNNRSGKDLLRPAGQDLFR
ncbi:MAG TPA: coenzyme F420-0:L-glutamate ligase [Acidobacteriota bacterium]|nr:coenzyme F420-0:L-glutamate ligase [Acidobacteriota bacterium]